MKTAHTLVCTLRLLSAAATIAAPLALGASLVACDDANDPKTWAKRLDDPAQKGKAIARLPSFYEDAMTRAGNKAAAPSNKELLHPVVEPMTKTYVAGGLDDKTRTDLM